MCSCTKKSKISGMKKFNLNNLTEQIIPVGLATVGFGAAKVVNKIDALQANPTLSGLTQLGLGIFLTTMRNKYIQNVGFGVALAGAHSFLAKPINDVLAKIGIEGIHGALPYTRSFNFSNTVMNGLNGINCTTETLY